MDIRTKIKSLPLSAGVYLMKDKSGRVIYVGKAAHLKKRVASYLNKSHTAYKNKVLLEHIYDIEIIPTVSEHEAFLLESRLIKRFKPRYNISLKDDKSFPFIKITHDDYPRVFIGRKNPSEDVDYFGPYTSAKLLRSALKSLRKVFGFCNCHRFPKSSCLDYHLGLCPGPCIGKISKRDYKKSIQDFKYFLNRGSSGLVKNLEERMQHCARIKKFEEAIKLREKIRSLGLLFQQSSRPDFYRLGLDKQPYRIEAFDVSNLFGNEAVGAMVTFIDGKPFKNDYRRFRIRMVEGIDDYKMIGEILNRRYSRVVKEDLTRPDLIIIDGGRGHLNIASQQLTDLGLHIPIIAIAKAKDLIYTVTEDRPIRLGRLNLTLQLIQRIRDEAHRFAIKYHKLLRKKKAGV